MIQAWITIGWFSLMYFLPFLVAEVRGHRQGFLILLVNLLAGWTGIGWIIAMIWAMGDEAEADHGPDRAGMPTTTKGASGGRSELDRVSDRANGLR
jgi:hypothetical protein